MSLLDEVLARRIVPVVVVRDSARAAGLADALVAADLPIAEVTLRTPAAPEAIAMMAKKSGLLVGAGTVLNAAQVDLAVDAGARFLVSPGYSADVEVILAKSENVLRIPSQAILEGKRVLVLDHGRLLDDIAPEELADG